MGDGDGKLKNETIVNWNWDTYGLFEKFGKEPSENSIQTNSAYVVSIFILQLGPKNLIELKPITYSYDAHV